MQDGDDYDGHDFGGGRGNGCGEGCCHGACCPGRGPIYVRVEYLLWWVKGASTPPLVTTSPQGTPQTEAGVLGQPGTSILFGDQPVNTGARSGGRITLGGWIDPTTRIEGSYFQLAQSVQTFGASSNGNPILAQPYFDVNPNSTAAAMQNASAIAYPGAYSGSINIRSTSSLLGADLHAIHNLSFTDFLDDRQHRLDFLFGWRYLRLRDNLAINSNVNSAELAGLGVVPSTVAVSDSFGTTNNFNGVDLGMVSNYRHARWSLQTIGRMALGVTSENVNIAGSNTTAGSPVGGLLTQASNIGSYQRNGFAVVPQLQLMLGYDVTPRFRCQVGYDIMYWSRVARPGDQIDTTLNLSQASGQPLVGAARPAFGFHETDLWVQGFSAGAEYRF
jgi:hypothetical protein